MNYITVKLTEQQAMFINATLYDSAQNTESKETKAFIQRLRTTIKTELVKL